MMRNLQPGLSENAPNRPGGGTLPEHGIRVEVPSRGGNLFAHVGRTFSCGHPVRGMCGQS